MIEFAVAGPYRVPVYRASTGGVDIDLKACVRALPKEHDGFEDRGCYVFSISVPHGYRPIYVGKTVKTTIIKEAFSASNQLKITRYLNESHRVDGLFISIVYKCSGGWGRNEREIGEIEEWLIANAAGRNPGLLNRRSVPRKNWVIRGVQRGAAKGRPENMAVAFQQMLGLRQPSPRSALSMTVKDLATAKDGQAIGAAVEAEADSEADISLSVPEIAPEVDA